MFASVHPENFLKNLKTEKDHEGSYMILAGIQACCYIHHHLYMVAQQ